MTTVVLLAAYNGEKDLPLLLTSLREQTFSSFTVLMQDDGSSDGTKILLEETAKQDPRFKFGEHQGEHLGAAGNFLSLLRQTDADRVLFCDQDDLWDAEKIEILSRAMDQAQADSAPGIPLLVHSDCYLTDGEGNRTAESFFRHQGWDPAALTLPRLLVQNNVTGCTLMMNRSLANLVAAHAKAKELFMHDWFVALTAAAFGRIVFVDQPLTGYRQHEGNAIGASKAGLLTRGLQALGKRKDARRRILLTYTHTLVFRKLYEGELPEDADRLTSAYLATKQMKKIPRVLAVRRLGCTMQSRITRIGQLLFG